MTTQTPKTLWTPEMEAHLRALVAENKLAYQAITTLFKKQYDAPALTRNSIAGKVHRLGLSTKGGQGHPRPQKPVSVVRSPKPAKTSQPPTEQSRPRRHTECWWETGPNTICLQPVTRGTLCAAHAEIAYRPRPEVARNRSLSLPDVPARAK